MGEWDGEGGVDFVRKEVDIVVGFGLREAEKESEEESETDALAEVVAVFKGETELIVLIERG